MVSKSPEWTWGSGSDAMADEIRRKTEQNVAYYAAHRDQVDQRLHELDMEWDVERLLQVSAGSVTLLGMLMRLMGRRLGTVLAVAAPAFLIYHAAQGWCPPYELLRRMGYRTRQEIDEERIALKAIRGDFRDLPPGERLEEVSRVVEAVRA